ncbi:MAG: type I-B CRISPR-associated protein Cas7/Csh2 [Cyclobacteriaceae bacterium]
MSTINNRTELLFLFEAENTNPNGDPMNENRPRYDAEDSTALVSDVRLKRTIRDYWLEYKGYNGENGKDIFVRETSYEGDKGEKFIVSGKRRAEKFKDSKEKVLEECLDVRVFGAVLPLKGDSLTFTGPVQFQMGRSLNKTEVTAEQGTGAFSSGDGKKQSTFRMEYKLPYALIGFNGIINEKAAQYTHMTEEDRALLMEGIWEGTKNLISRSKYGQFPLLMVAIHYKDTYQIGSLRQRLQVKSKEGVAEKMIRSTEDYTLDVGRLREAIREVADKIAHVEVRVDNRLQLVDGDEEVKWISKNYQANEL